MSGTDAGVCKEASSYDGTAVVLSVAATAIKLSFGSDCELGINNDDPAVLPALQQGATLWLTWRASWGRVASKPSTG